MLLLVCAVVECATVWHAGRLSEQQAGFVESWLGEPTLVEDFSWGLVDTVVLHLRTDAADVIVKAGGRGNHHIGREITAHERFTAPLAELGAAARLIAASREANLLATEYLEGQLVEGGPAEFELQVHEQAGRLLRVFHDLASHADDTFERLATQKSLAWLDSDHRIAPEHERAARAILTDYEPATVTVVPTHGDWQPRNWLVHRDHVRVIDFGRFAFRPAETDLCRLAAQQWRDRPRLEAAFLQAYGLDPRSARLWPMVQLREAIGTAAWAYQVGDERFEVQGHRMLAEALGEF